MGLLGEPVGVPGALFWLILAVILFVVEGATVQLVCIWFAFGALFAMLASFVWAPLWVQLLIFLITSIGVLIIGRPLLMDRLERRKEPTNHDRVIGQVGIVLEQIDNVEQTGKVSANGLDWTARSERGEVIPPRTRVLVKFIDGVKLIVEPLREQEEPEREPVELPRESSEIEEEK